jgi:hypothetical protein
MAHFVVMGELEALKQSKPFWNWKGLLFHDASLPDGIMTPWNKIDGTRR